MEKYNKKYEISINFNSIIKQVQKLTNNNAHGLAIEYIAKTLKFKKIENIMKHINAIHNILGEMPYNLIEYRNIILKNTLNLIEKKYGKEIKNLFYKVT